MSKRGRTQGFVITGKFFVPADPSDIDEFQAIVKSVKAAVSGDLSRLQTAHVMNIETKFMGVDLDKKTKTAPAPSSGESTGPKKTRSAA